MFIKNIYNKIFKTKTDYKLQKKINLFKDNYEKIIFENNYKPVSNVNVKIDVDPQQSL